MPKRTDLHSILLIGSGPIVIGQGCEFDYSGTQACKALREEGYRVVLINANPATIMTDPNMADRTYIEPITPEIIANILHREQSLGTPVDAILPTLGGQTGLNCAMEAAELGILERYDVAMIGATAEAIHKAEERTAFKATMQAIGLDVPRSGIAHTLEEACAVLRDVGLPCCIRPAYTLGGEGGGFCRTDAAFRGLARKGIAASRVGEILIEESLYGWKEFELEVMRDRADNVVIICSIENIDPMGVHTGDSITVAPAQTLTDKEYQRLRDSAIRIIRAIGVDTGGCNIQFGIDPATGRQIVIEMNPRVSRSSALASKATGYPIARVAAKLAVGYTLDELPNDITRTTPASFEPTIDYCVVKMPRWNFEKFPDADESLNTQMKSVGEAMAIGRTFKEAFQKCIRSMEIKRDGFGLDGNDQWLQERRHIPSPDDDATVPTLGGTTATEAPPDTQKENARAWPIPRDVLRDKLSNPCQGRPYYVRYAFKMGWSVEQVHELTRIDPWFLDQMRQLVLFEDELLVRSPLGADGKSQTAASVLTDAKKMGYTDVQCRAARYDGPEPAYEAGRLPVYKLVDTCAAEFEAATPYYYSSHEVPALLTVSGAASEAADEIRVTDRPKIIVLGGGPNRIGQGIEFDYCCCHASYAARDAGFESVMINSNPETVSTDFDTSDLLFFEPLTHEDVLHVIRRLNGRPLTLDGARSARATDPRAGAAHGAAPAGSDVGFVKGVIVQFGGQTPLNLADGLKRAGVPILGTQPEMLHLAEDREAFQQVIKELSLLQPPSGIARTRQQAATVAERIGFPILVRPSYVLGGRGMKVCNNRQDLDSYLNEAFDATDRTEAAADNPILIDKFLSEAIEVDVDAVADFGLYCDDAPGDPEDVAKQSPHDPCNPRGTCMVAGILEHIEEAGIHSGDSTCVTPPFSLGRMVIEELYRSTKRLARRLSVCGAINIQYAILNRTVYVLEVNPRASRTLPFIAKATGIPWAAIATRVMLGEPLSAVLADHDIRQTPQLHHTAIKAPVFPFGKFTGVDVILGPEMRSTGEVMAIDSDFGRAFAKAQVATQAPLPISGNALVSVNDADKARCVSIARELYDLGFTIYSTLGTRQVLAEAGIAAKLVSKSCETHDAPFLKDLIENGTLDLLINTPMRSGPASDEGRWRAAAIRQGVPLITTLAGARAAVTGIRALTKTEEGELALPLDVKPLQEYFANRMPASKQAIHATPTRALHTPRQSEPRP
ncbi:MAG: carbamoyl-phosphate synthase large subunit [Phycisphaerae bacterium]